MTDTSFVASNEPHPALLTRKGTDALIAVEHMLDDANHALTAQDAAGGPPPAFSTAANKARWLLRIPSRRRRSRDRREFTSATSSAH